MNLKKWRISKIQTTEGTRWILEKLRIDASKPYYLTERVFRFQGSALAALRAKEEEVISDEFIDKLTK